MQRRTTVVGLRGRMDEARLFAKRDTGSESQRMREQAPPLDRRDPCADCQGHCEECAIR